MRLRKIINIKRSPLSKLVATASFPKSFIGDLDTKRVWIPAFAGMTSFGLRVTRNRVFYNSPIMIIFCLGVFFFGAGAASEAKESQGKNLPVEAEAAIDKTSIQIGDKFTYAITVKAQSNIEVEFPHVLPENLAGFAIKDFGSSQKGLFGRRVFRQWFLLDTYVSGEHTIPAAVVKYRAKGSADWRELSVNEVKAEVKSVLDAASTRTDIRDIRGPKSFTEKIWLYALTALAVLAIIGAALALLLLIKRKNESGPPPVPAHIIAYKALAVLEKRDYIGKGQIKAYYVELSDIVRYYLENRFNIRAPEMTTEEFLVKVKEDSALSLEHKGLLRDFLLNCDLVKFAKYQPAEREAALSFASAKRLIDQTKEEAAAPA